MGTGIPMHTFQFYSICMKLICMEQNFTEYVPRKCVVS